MFGIGSGEGIQMDEIECDIDEEMNNEHFSGKNINDSFINKLRDISTFNPSGIKGKEKTNNSMMILPPSSIDLKLRNRDSFVANSHMDNYKHFLIDPYKQDGYNSHRNRQISANYLKTDSPEKNLKLNIEASQLISNRSNRNNIRDQQNENRRKSGNSVNQLNLNPFLAGSSQNTSPLSLPASPMMMQTQNKTGFNDQPQF